MSSKQMSLHVSFIHSMLKNQYTIEITTNNNCTYDFYAVKNLGLQNPS